MGNESLSLNKLTRILPSLITFILMVICALYLIFSFYAWHRLGNRICFVVCHNSTHGTRDVVLCPGLLTPHADELRLFNFSELNPGGRNLAAYKMEMVWMFLHSVEGPLFLPTSPCLTTVSSFSHVKIGKGERGSSLGEIGLWRIVSAHSEAILSSEKYNELELWVLPSLPLMFPPSPPPLHLITFSPKPAVFPP